MIKIDDTELAAELAGMHIASWEMRYAGKGKKKLYIRFEPDVKPLKVTLKKGK